MSAINLGDILGWTVETQYPRTIPCWKDLEKIRLREKWDYVSVANLTKNKKTIRTRFMCDLLLKQARGIRGKIPYGGRYFVLDTEKDVLDRIQEVFEEELFCIVRVNKVTMANSHDLHIPESLSQELDAYEKIWEKLDRDRKAGKVLKKSCIGDRIAKYQMFKGKIALYAGYPSHTRILSHNEKRSLEDRIDALMRWELNLKRT